MQDEIIDARGLKCPIPVLKAEKFLQNCPAGTKLIIIADDPVARVDIPVFCQNNNHSCEVTNEGSSFSFTITAKTN